MSDAISALIDRVERATGPDREIDDAIEFALVPKEHRHWVPDPWTGDRHYCGRPYTSSLDAVVALVERELPGWTIANISQGDNKRWHAELREGYLTSYNRVALSGLYSTHGDRKPGSPNGALALLLAFLRAKSTPAKEA